MSQNNQQPGQPGAEQPIKGIGLTRSQIIGYIQSRTAQGNVQSEVVKELYDREDYSLVTETHAQMIIPKVRMKMVLHAIDPDRDKSLIQCFLDDYNIEMISYERKGRLELLGALQALEASEDAERSTRV